MNSIPTNLLIFGGIVVLFLFLGFVNNLMQGWANRMNDVNRPMTVTHFTERTPAQLNRGANAARWERRLFVAGLLIGAWVLLYLVDSALALAILALLGTVLRELLVAVGDLIDLVLNSVGN